MALNSPRPPKSKRKQKRALNKKPAFLKSFIACASLTDAAKAIGIDRGQHYDWLRDDPKYAIAFEAAKLQAAQTLEDDAVEWARRGIFEPLVYQGQFQYAQRPVVICTLPDGRKVREQDLPEPIGDVKIQSRCTTLEAYGPPLGIYRRSEGLLGRLMKAFMPARYGERVAVEASGPGGGPVQSILTIEFVRPKDQEKS